MPVPFSSIPDHIRISIVQKFDFKEFLSFNESSRDAMDIVNKVKTPIYIHLGYKGPTVHLDEENEEIYIKFYPKKTYRKVNFNILVRFEISGFTIEGTLTDIFCIALTNLFCFPKKIDSSKIVLCNAKLNCSFNSLNYFLETLEVESANFFWVSFPKPFLRMPVLDKLNGLAITSPLENIDLELLKMPRMTLWGTSLTGSAINVLLKEYLSGQRNLNIIQIRTLSRIDKSDVFDGIPYSESMPWNTRKEIYMVGEGDEKPIKFTIEPGGRETEVYIWKVLRKNKTSSVE